VFGFAIHLTGDRSDAEDLTQDTFVAAFQGRRSYRGTGTPLSWLLGIAARRWRDTRRRRHHSPVASASEATDERDPPGPDPSGPLLGIALRQELQRLPDDQREAFLLVVSQGLSYAEASAATGVRTGTLKWRVHRAARHLRRTLFAQEEPANGLHTEMGR
jgi:RNA polymerase sigma-70 factor (ECF subfamily)